MPERMLPHRVANNTPATGDTSRPCQSGGANLRDPRTTSPKTSTVAILRPLTSYGRNTRRCSRCYASARPASHTVCLVYSPRQGEAGGKDSGRRIPRRRRSTGAQATAVRVKRKTAPKTPVKTKKATLHTTLITHRLAAQALGLVRQNPLKNPVDPRLPCGAVAISLITRRGSTAAAAATAAPSRRGARRCCSAHVRIHLNRG